MQNGKPKPAAKRRSKRRQKQVVPLMLFWNRRDQMRFIEAVERLVSQCNDLGLLIDLLRNVVTVIEANNQPKRRRPAKLDQAPAVEGGAL